MVTRNRRNVVKLALVCLLACAACAGLALLAINLAPHLLPALLGLTHVGSLESALPSSTISLVSAGAPLDHVALLLPPYLPQPLNLTPADLGDGEITGDATVPGTSTAQAARQQKTDIHVDGPRGNRNKGQCYLYGLQHIPDDGNIHLCHPCGDG